MKRFAGLVRATKMVRVVTIITDIVITVANVIVIAKGAEATLRFAVISALKFVGARDPRWVSRIPRLIPWRSIWNAYVRYREWCEEHFGLGQDSSALSPPLTQLNNQYEDGDSLMGCVCLFNPEP